MTLQVDSGTLRAVDDILDASHLVSFWLDVTASDKFIFRKFNKFYEQEVGLNTAPLIGRTPEEVLPERQAETVSRNYEKCRSTGDPYTYEELLELGRGSVWWKTTLSPIKDKSERVIGILGQCVDITASKEKEFEAAKLQAKLSGMNEELRMFASLAAQDMRNPFMTISGLITFLSDGFVDLGDGKKDMLDYCGRVCAEGMSQLEGIMSRAQSLTPAAEAVTDVDLSHLCGDLVAIVDANKRFDIGFPDNELRTDRVALQLVLRTLLENAMRFCDKRIEITVFDDSEGRLLFTVYDDGSSDAHGRRPDGSLLVPDGTAGPGYSGLNLVRDLIHARGGTLEARRTDVRLGVEVCFSLPGEIVGWHQKAPIAAKALMENLPIQETRAN